jgi:hypothetical protein
MFSILDIIIFYTKIYVINLVQLNKIWSTVKNYIIILKELCGIWLIVSRSLSITIIIVFIFYVNYKYFILGLSFNLFSGICKDHLLYGNVFFQEVITLFFLNISSVICTLIFLVKNSLIYAYK